MKRFEGLEAFAAFLLEQAETEPERLLAAAGAASLIIKGTIQGVFGDQQKLAALAPSTVEQRARKGDADPTRPLLIDGTLLRDSIQAEHAPFPGGAIAGVGSSEPILVYHEVGSGNYPPRPAFSIGVYESMPIVQKMLNLVLRPGYNVALRGGGIADLTDPDRMMSLGYYPRNMKPPEE